MHIFRSIRDLEWNNPEGTRATGKVEIVGYEADGVLPYTFDLTDYVIQNVHVRSSEPNEDGTYEDRPFSAAELFAAFERGEFGEVKPYVAPPPPPPTLVSVYKLDLFERTTETEADAILAAIREQPARTRMIFEAAQSFREDHELWPLLKDAATDLFGPERASELLAPSA